MKHQLSNELITLAASALLAASSCSDVDRESDDAGDDAAASDAGDADAGSGLDAETPADADEADSDQEADSLPEPWDEVTYHPLTEAGDRTGDCAAEDEGCFEADIVQLSYGVAGGDLFFDLRFAGPFMEIERQIGSFEIFAFPAEAGLVGHSIRNVGGSMSFWDADCTSERKHDGCHWYSERELPTFEMAWMEPGRLLCRVSLSQWGFDGLSELWIGVAAAPFLIWRSAQFTDRYPDELWITSTEITGLELVSFETER